MGNRSYRSDKEDNPPCERPGCAYRMKIFRLVSFVGFPIPVEQTILSFIASYSSQWNMLASHAIPRVTLGLEVILYEKIITLHISFLPTEDGIRRRKILRGKLFFPLSP